MTLTEALEVAGTVEDLAAVLHARPSTVQRWLLDGVPTTRQAAVDAILSDLHTHLDAHARATAGRRFADRIAQTGLTMKQFGALVGVTNSTVYLWTTRGVPDDHVSDVEYALTTTIDPTTLIAGERLREALTIRGLTNADASAVLGVPVSTIRQWQRNGVPAARTTWVHDTLAQLPGGEIRYLTVPAGNHPRNARTDRAAQLTAVLAEVPATALATRLDVSAGLIAQWVKLGVSAHAIPAVDQLLADTDWITRHRRAELTRATHPALNDVDPTALATAAGVSVPAVYRWRDHGIPARYAPGVLELLNNPQWVRDHPHLTGQIMIPELADVSTYAVADALNVHWGTVFRWRRVGVPASRAHAVNALLDDPHWVTAHRGGADRHPRPQLWHAPATEAARALNINVDTLHRWRIDGVPDSAVTDIDRALASPAWRAIRYGRDDVSDIPTDTFTAFVNKVSLTDLSDALGVQISKAKWTTRGVPARHAEKLRMLMDDNEWISAHSHRGRGRPPRTQTYTAIEFTHAARTISIQALARRLNVTGVDVNRWKVTGVPETHAPAVASALADRDWVMCHPRKVDGWTGAPYARGDLEEFIATVTPEALEAELGVVGVTRWLRTRPPSELEVRLVELMADQEWISDTIAKFQIDAEEFSRIMSQRDHTLTARHLGVTVRDLAAWKRDGVPLGYRERVREMVGG